MLTVTVTGLEEIRAATDPATFERSMAVGLWEAAEALMNTVKGNMPDVSGFGSKGIPVDTGRLKGSVERRKVQLLAAEVYAGTNYSLYVHDGTAKTPARPFFRWALEDFGAKEKMEKVMIEKIGSGLRLRVV